MSEIPLITISYPIKTHIGLKVYTVFIYFLSNFQICFSRFTVALHDTAIEDALGINLYTYIQLSSLLRANNNWTPWCFFRWPGVSDSMHCSSANTHHIPVMWRSSSCFQLRRFVWQNLWRLAELVDLFSVFQWVFFFFWTCANVWGSGKQLGR